jgi:hypothetical protein
MEPDFGSTNKNGRQEFGLGSSLVIQHPASILIQLDIFKWLGNITYMPFQVAKPVFWDQQDKLSLKAFTHFKECKFCRGGGHSSNNDGSG